MVRNSGGHTLGTNFLLKGLGEFRIKIKPAILNFGIDWSKYFRQLMPFKAVF
jgi:hypothetical protein